MGIYDLINSLYQIINKDGSNIEVSIRIGGTESRLLHVYVDPDTQNIVLSDTEHGTGGRT